MKTALIGALAGALSGALIAGGLAWRLHEEKEKDVPASAQVARRPILVPPGWDLRLVGRLANVEDRLSTLETAPKPGPSEPQPTGDSVEGANPPEDEGERRTEIAEQYEKDLGYQRDAIAAHAAEPRDDAWARSQGDLVAETLKSENSADTPYKVAQVDCRSKTCLAEVSFPSPEAALIARNARVGMIAVPNCNGASSALERPTDSGPYIVKTVYHCAR